MGAAEQTIDRLRSLAREVHVWLVAPDEVRDPDRLAVCASLLSRDESRRRERLRLERDRHTFLVAHALVRSALSRYADVPPGEWVFQVNRWGRPEIAGPAAAPALRFSLSHTAGLAACAVARDCECGVDVESLDRGGDPLRVARRVLSPAELADLEAQPAEARRGRFLAYWTLKEAYAKACGVGLSLPLRQVSFTLTAERIDAALDARGADAGEAWQFASLRPTPRHALGVALRRGAGPDRKIIVRQATPGAW